MSVICPSCQHKMNVKAAKPGRYKVKCAKCGLPFTVTLAADGTTSAPAPKHSAPPDADLAATVVTAVQAPAQPPKAPPDPDVTSAAGDEHAPDNPREVTVNLPNPPGDAQPSQLAANGPDINAAQSERDPAIPEATLAVANIEAVGKTRGNREATAAFAIDEQAESDLPPAVGNYEIIRCLGKGGMGAVYLARQRSLDRPVAFKVIHPRWAQDARFLVRFTREAYAAAQLVHHNVVQVYDIGADQGINWFSMEFVDGTSLGALLTVQGRLDPRTAAGYILQAARGLQFAHERGMVHRDVKPDNLMLNKQGIVKVADLGLVRTPGATDELPAAPEPNRPRAKSKKLASAGTLASLSGVTLLNQTMGTPSYMSPEQTRSASTVDERADIYSLGCTLYTLITGQTVFKARNAQEMMKKQQTEPPIPPDAIVKTVPKALSDIIVKTLAKDPADRYQTTGDLVRALEGFLDIGAEDRATLAEEQADTLARGVEAYRDVPAARRRPLILGGALALCGIAVLLSLLFGAWVTAGSFLGLAVLTPLAHFVVSGSATRSYLFLQVRQYVLASGVLDWIKAVAGLLLFCLILYFTGLLLAWVLVCGFAIGLAFAVHFLLDRPIARQRQGAFSDVEKMLQGMRVRGLAEEAIQKYVCQFAGDYWEEAFEELFGYDAKLAARGRWGVGPKGARPKFAAWRDPVVFWIQTRQRARQEARERKHLQAVEQKNLVADGMQPAAARRQAEAVAEAMVEKAAQIKVAEFVDDALVEEVVSQRVPQMKSPDATVAHDAADDFELIEDAPPPPRRARVDMRELVAVAEQPLPLRRRSPLLPKLIGLFRGAGGRFLIGGLLLCAGLGGLHASKIADELTTLTALDPETWKAGLKLLVEPRTLLSLPLLPELTLKPATCLAAVVAGLLLLVTGFQTLRWRSLLHYGLALVTIAGPRLGVPDVGPIDAALVSLAVGGGLAFLLIAVPWLRRRRAPEKKTSEVSETSEV